MAVGRNIPQLYIDHALQIMLYKPCFTNYAVQTMLYKLCCTKVGKGGASKARDGLISNSALFQLGPIEGYHIMIIAALETSFALGGRQSWCTLT